jgi:Lar family restriction alleviation protein
MRRDAIRRRAGGAIVSEMTLEPCPFCGTTDIEVYPTDRERARWNVCCGNPGCVTRSDDDYLTESDAVSAWNRRTHIAQHAEMADRLKLEAQCHAQEARTANATIAEIYQLCSGGKGEPGNWHGAEPVRALLGQHAEVLAAHTALVERLHDVTTMLEAERARIAGAPVSTTRCRFENDEDGEVFLPSCFDLPRDFFGKRVALVVLP